MHIIRAFDDRRALSTARAHSQQHDTSILLLHDAVLTPPTDFRGRIYACSEDVAARAKVGNRREVDYGEIVRLIFEHDKVIAW